MDNNTFFSEKNTDLIYTICRDDVLKKTNYNIDSNKKYFKTFGQIMKIVHKHADDKTDLNSLNNKTIGKTIPYLVDEIGKKKLKEKPLIPTTNILNAPPIRQESIASRNNKQNGLPVSFRASSTINHGSLQTDLNRIVEERKQYHDIPDNLNLTIEDNTNYEDPNVLLDKQMKEREMLNDQHKPNLEQKTVKPEKKDIPRVQRTLLETETALKNTELNLQSYDLNEDVLSNLYGNTDLNTYNQNNDDVDPMKLFQEQMNQRDNEDSDYKRMQNDTINFEEQQKMDNQIIDSMKDTHELKKKEAELEFQNSLSQRISREMDQMNIDGIKSQIDRRMEQKLDEVILPPTANDLQRVQDNKLDVETKEFFQMKQELFEKRNYINREHLLIVNSGDRDWMNDSEDRYSFQVRFKPSSGDTFEMVPKVDENGITVRQTEMGVDEAGRKIYTGDIVYEKKRFKGEQGLGVDNLYRNIVSFEMVRVLMAIENIIIPFDNRFFIDYKSLPYIALKIDEIQPLYDGTNGRINNTFAKLLFDKDHTNTVIVNPKQANGTDDFSRKYSRQLTRGYSSMAPMSNEKKTFYPSPLASLNRLTISMLTPYGSNIRNHPDVLEITELKYVALNELTLDLDNTTGFLNDDVEETETFYLEVTTSTAFSNRVFKLGDNVRFKGFNSDSSDSNIGTFIDFINREEGHYIINQQLEETGKDKNEGYITKFYISPPGNVNYSSSGSITDNYQIGTDNLKNSEQCKILNQSIQTHFVFKVVTREDDMTPVMKAVNV